MQPGTASRAGRYGVDVVVVGDVVVVVDEVVVDVELVVVVVVTSVGDVVGEVPGGGAVDGEGGGPATG